ncbi:MAG: iron-containing alcohol dehydrogenase [Clostridiales bacterium]|jgi:alcohol dehydrogenase|nr:iron-containing alcohol dehydrogenase [Clostridiales bacterium]
MPLILPKEVIIKKYALISAGKYIGQYGRHCLIIAGKHFFNGEDADILYASLTLKGVRFEAEEYPGGEPITDYIDEVTESYRDSRGNPTVDSVVGIGGGSVLDTAKAVSGMLKNDGGIERYLEPSGKVLENTPLPFIAVPTTAGTGAEATKNAVIKNIEKRYKRSIRDERLVAKTVIIDPTLYVCAPGEVTANSGMDALTQLIEAFTSVRATDETDEYCRRGLNHIQYLAAAYADGENLSAREQTALAAYESGVAIANSGVGAVHALASPIGAHTGLPHGLICGILLPYVMELNKERAQAKYAEIGRILTGADGTDKIMADKAIKAIKSLAESLKIPATFRNERIKTAAEAIVKECIGGGSMLSNPVQFDEQVWIKLLLKASK